MIDLTDPKSEEIFRDLINGYISKYSSHLNNIIRISNRYIFDIDDRIKVSVYYSAHFTDFSMYTRADIYNTSRETLQTVKEFFKVIEPFFKNDSDFKQAVGLVAGKIVLKEYSKSIYATLSYVYGELLYTLYIRNGSDNDTVIARIQENKPKVRCENANKDCKRYKILKQFFKDFGDKNLNSRELNLLRYGYQLDHIPERDATVKLLRSIFKEDYSIQTIHNSRYDYKCRSRCNSLNFVEFTIDDDRSVYIYDYLGYNTLMEFVNTIKLFNIDYTCSGRVNI